MFASIVLGLAPHSSRMEHGASRAGAACPIWDHSSCEGTAHCPPRCPRFVDGAGVPLVIGPYERRDFEALVVMYDDLDEASRTMGLPPERTADIEDWLSGLVEGGWNLVARRDGRIVGHVGVAPGDAATPQFVVFVDDEFQERGVGSELLCQLVAYAADRNHDRIRLDVSKTNRRAISLYDGLGFAVSDRSPCDVAMELPLDRPIADRVRRPPAERE